MPYWHCVQTIDRPDTGAFVGDVERPGTGALKLGWCGSRLVAVDEEGCVWTLDMPHGATRFESLDVELDSVALAVTQWPRRVDIAGITGTTLSLHVDAEPRVLRREIEGVHAAATTRLGCHLLATDDEIQRWIGGDLLDRTPIDDASIRQLTPVARVASDLIAMTDDGSVASLVIGRHVSVRDEWSTRLPRARLVRAVSRDAWIASIAPTRSVNDGRPYVLTPQGAVEVDARQLAMSNDGTAAVAAGGEGVTWFDLDGPHAPVATSLAEDGAADAVAVTADGTTCAVAFPGCVTLLAPEWTRRRAVASVS